MSSSADIKTRAVSAVKWAVLGTVLRFGLQLGIQIALTRLLGPDHYGLFAMGLLVMALSNFLADFGFSWGLVQNQDVQADDVRFAFTWQFISGTVAMLGLYLLSPTIAAYFKEPRLEPVVCWLSITCLLTAITAPGSNLLRRKLDFRWLNIIQILSYMFGYLGVGIALACHGAGVWALVGACLSQAACAFVLTCLRSPPSWKPLLWYPGARRSTNTGSTVFVTNLCNWFLNNLDRVFLGRLLNAHAVGMYAAGYNLANTPNSLFLSALQPAFLAAGARMQDERGMLREAYLSVLAAIWIVVAPMFMVLAFAADDLVVVLYGPNWADSGRVLAILALAMPAYITWGMSTPVLWNTDGKHLESLLQLPVLAVAALALYLFAGQGVAVAAMVASATLLLRALVIGTAACRRLDITCANLWPSARSGAIVMLLAAAGTRAGSAWGHQLSHGAWLPLLLACCGGAGIVIGASLIFPRLLGLRVVELFDRFSPPVPARLGVYLRRKCSVR